MAEKGFVEMEKEGMHLVVHPSTVESHRAVGWQVVRENVALEADVVDEGEKNGRDKEKREVGRGNPPNPPPLPKERAHVPKRKGALVKGGLIGNFDGE